MPLLEAVQRVPGRFPGIGDGMAEMGMIALCGGNPLHGFLRNAAPVAALAGGGVTGILYLRRGVDMQIEAPRSSEPPAS